MTGSLLGRVVLLASIIAIGVILGGGQSQDTRSVKNPIVALGPGGPSIELDDLGQGLRGFIVCMGGPQGKADGGAPAAFTAGTKRGCISVRTDAYDSLDDLLHDVAARLAAMGVAVHVEEETGMALIFDPLDATLDERLYYGNSDLMIHQSAGVMNKS